MTTTNAPLRLSRRPGILCACLAILLGAYGMSGAASKAEASEAHFCTQVNLGPMGWCEDSYKTVTRSWGRSLNGNAVCVTAWNSGGGTPGGSVCGSSTSFFSNGNFNGSLWLKAGIWNPATWEVFYAKVNYNP